MKGDLAMTQTDLSSMKTYLSLTKGDLSSEKIDRVMAKGDLGKSITKVDLGKVKANMGRVKVDMDEEMGVAVRSVQIEFWRGKTAT